MPRHPLASAWAEQGRPGSTLNDGTTACSSISVLSQPRSRGKFTSKKRSSASGGDRSKHPYVRALEKRGGQSAAAVAAIAEGKRACSVHGQPLDVCRSIMNEEARESDARERWGDYDVAAGADKHIEEWMRETLRKEVTTALEEETRRADEEREESEVTDDEDGEEEEVAEDVMYRAEARRKKGKRGGKNTASRKSSSRRRRSGRRSGSGDSTSDNDRSSRADLQRRHSRNSKRRSGVASAAGSLGRLSPPKAPIPSSSGRVLHKATKKRRHSRGQSSMRAKNKRTRSTDDESSGDEAAHTPEQHGTGQRRHSRVRLSGRHRRKRQLLSL